MPLRGLHASKAIQSLEAEVVDTHTLSSDTHHGGLKSRLNFLSTIEFWHTTASAYLHVGFLHTRRIAKWRCRCQSLGLVRLRNMRVPARAVRSGMPIASAQAVKRDCVLTGGDLLRRIGTGDDDCRSASQCGSVCFSPHVTFDDCCASLDSVDWPRPSIWAGQHDIIVRK